MKDPKQAVAGAGEKGKRAEKCGLCGTREDSPFPLFSGKSLGRSLSREGAIRKAREHAYTPAKYAEGVYRNYRDTSLSNYREVLLHLDKPLPAARGGPYEGGHWKSIVEDVVLHFRLGDYVAYSYADPANEKGETTKRVLVIQEIQSDPHQKGRKYGYYTRSVSAADVERLRELRNAESELEEINSELRGDITNQELKLRMWGEIPASTLRDIEAQLTNWRDQLDQNTATLEGMKADMKELGIELLTTGFQVFMDLLHGRVTWWLGMARLLRRAACAHRNSAPSQAVDER